MPRTSEFSSYVFIKNDLNTLRWRTTNPNRDPLGQVYTQQECLDNPEIGPFLGSQRPEYVVKIYEDAFWIIEAKGRHEDLTLAFTEAKSYAQQISQNPNVRFLIISGVAGNDTDGYLIHSAILQSGGITADITYNDRNITALLSPDQARYLVDNNTFRLNDLVTDEEIFLTIAEKINEKLHEASINKDVRASVIASILLSMVSDTLPNFNANPDVFIRDINNRAEDVLIANSKREFAGQIELKLPLETAAKAKYKDAIVKVFFLLRKINIKAAMNGHQDILGKFYEVFLKYGNGAKDIGIVLTPRHLTKFCAEILDINANDIIYDPACGTGGFLVAGYDRVRLSGTGDIDLFRKHKIFGIEQQANVAALAIVNMIFRGDGKNNIINDNCFAKSLERTTRNGDLTARFIDTSTTRPAITKVLMNPPFALKKGDEQEYKFLDHALAQMVEGGLLVSVLPISVMYSSGTEKVWRTRTLENNTLLSVLSFSNELFYPQCGVEPVVIIIKKGIPHGENQRTLWIRIINDGFKKLKRRRYPLDGDNDLTIFAPVIKNFIFNGIAPVEVPGFCQLKKIDFTQTSLELIPQQYLDNAAYNQDILTKEIKNLYSSVVFERLNKEIKHENI